MGIRLMCVGVVLCGLIYLGAPAMVVGILFIVVGAILALIGK